jgi:hypothetical protein
MFNNFKKCDTNNCKNKGYGNTGYIGPSGMIGPTGPIGSTGPIGYIGFTGYNGIVGCIGNTGPTGPIGDKGTNGNTGQQGPPFKGVVSQSVYEPTISFTSTELPIYNNINGPIIDAIIGTSGKALVSISTKFTLSSTSSAYMSFNVGPIVSNDTTAIYHSAFSATTESTQFTGTFLVSGLTPGNNTFTTVIRVATGSASFSNRSIIVIPID